jgi:hypothetical protein
MERLARVLADDVCLRIVFELNRRPMSMMQFYREFGGAPYDGIRSRFKKLENVRWIERVGERTGGKRRGAREVLFRATKPAMESDHAWRNPSDSLRQTGGWRTFERFCEKAVEAMRAGTFDARLDRVVTLSFLHFDQEGWVKATAGVDSFAAFLLKEQACAKERLHESGEQPIAVTVGLAAFESPTKLAKEP